MLKNVFLACTILLSLNIQAQNSVSIGTEDINENAVLQLVSPDNNQGFLITRLTSIQRNAMNLTSEDNGMIIYDTDQRALFYWHDNIWYQVQHWRPEGWNLTGNSFIDPEHNYLGTSDNRDLIIKTNGQERISIDGNNGYVDITSDVNISSNIHIDGEYHYNSQKDRYLTFSFSDLQIEGDYRANYQYNYIDNFTEAFLPVHLPDNATIQNVIVGVRDENSTESITVQFIEIGYTHEDVPSGNEIIFEETTPGFTHIVVNNINRLVNNQQNSYYMRITCTAPADALGFVGAQIHYTVLLAD